jgi:hypothetical protein
MPAYSTIDLINEIYFAIISLECSKFTTNQLVQRINQFRREKGKKMKVSSESVNRILTELWLPLGIRKTGFGEWEKGTGPIRGITNIRPDIVKSILTNLKLNTTPADVDRWIGLANEPTTHKVYICYPYHDNPLKRSMELLVLLIHLYPKAKDSFVPATPHEMYWGLEERTDRETAMAKCAELIKKCDFLLYCLRKNQKPSKGMKQDMDIAKAEGKKIIYIEDLLGYYPNIDETLRNCGLPEFAETRIISTTVQ